MPTTDTETGTQTAIERVHAKLDRLPDSDAITIEKITVREVLDEMAENEGVIRLLRRQRDEAEAKLADRHARTRALAREWRSGASRCEGLALDELLDSFEED